MQEANDLRAILNAAEQAAASDDAAAAERLLREALALQESTAGSPRDEIARTLNNLAVVCEMTGKMADAETCYRRAYAIATATLPPSDPFVTTSRENLVQFCTSQGIPLERPAAIAARAPSPAPLEPEPAPAAAVAAPSPPAPAAPPRVEAPRAASPAATAASRPTTAAAPTRVARPVVPAPTEGGSRSIIVSAIILIAVVVAIVTALFWFASGASPEPAAPQPAAPASQSEPAPPPEAAPAPEAPAPAPAPAPVAPTPPERPPTTAPSSAPTVISAQICRSLSVADSWRCDVVSGTTGAGPIYFFTRVAAARDTTVEHRWYRDGRLHQSVELHIGANPGGFRTYSRTTVGAEQAGNWKVELRAADGRVLHEDTFSVR
jgi:hypothetical protein